MTTTTPNPMDLPPKDFGSDRYDYVEVTAPPGVRPLGQWFDNLIAAPCQDCRANVFLRWEPDDTASAWDPACWQIAVAHDATCPQCPEEWA